MSQNAPLSVPYQQVPRLATPSVSLLTMQAATSPEAVAEFATRKLAGTGWELKKTRKRATRLEPPHAYWVIYELVINKDEEERRLRLVARGSFDASSWESLRDQLVRHGRGFPCEPLESIGYPEIFDEAQVAYWFYPFDLALPGLPHAADARTMWHVFAGLDGVRPRGLAGVDSLHIERVRYTPEISAILRYDLDSGAHGRSTLYGKVQPGTRGLRTYRIEESLWQAAQESDGLLQIPRPVGFIADYGMLLEEAAPGEPVKGDRNTREFMGVGPAAAEAIAVVHESGLEPDEHIHPESEIERLASVAEQFVYVDPKAHFLMNELVLHLRDRLERTYEEELVPTHADLKYDQFMVSDGRYTLIDFDYFAQAETSYDLAKFCAYLIPSTPRDWEESVAAEATRRAFLRRYMELRPYAKLDRFQLYEATILALRSMTMMWSQHQGWELAAETFLVMAQERLNSRLPE